MTKTVALVRHPLAMAGVVLATAAGVAFVVLLLAVLFGLFDNPYAGLVVGIAIPALLVLGLLLIPIGMRLERRKRARDPNAPTDWPVFDFRDPGVRRTALVVVALTMVNVVIVLLAGYGTLHWMESPRFCGQVCHTPMHPQFTAWNAGPHAGTACATCHIGEGPKGFVHAKLAGIRQLVQVATNSVPKPIPPGAHMPPGSQAQTCRGCHKPERMVGDAIKVIREYGDDEANSETTTVLQMHVGRSPVGRSIHWHADPAVRVEYVATDATKETIPYVKVTGAGGQVKEFVAADAKRDAIAAGTLRTMDCIDCHNTVGHPIAPSAEQAVDQTIAAGLVSRQLPNVRREGIRLVKGEYESEDTAVAAIDREFRMLYSSRSGPVDEQAVTRAVAALQAVYRRNVFPTMKVTWGSYPDNRGHVTATGCFRCHDDSHKDTSGAVISADCDYCHKQIEQ